MMRKKSLFNLRSLFIITILGVIALSVISYFRMVSLIHNAQWVNHTNIVRYVIEKTSGALTDAETNQRGFILTDDTSFLRLRNEALEQVEINLKYLDSLLKDSKNQKNNLVRLRSNISLRINSLNEVLAEKEKLTLAPKIVYETIRGKDLMKLVKESTEQMLVEEQRLLEKRSHDLKMQIRLTPFLITVLMIGAVFIITISYFRLNNQLKIIRSLRTSEEQLRNVLEGLPQLAWKTEPNGSASYFNHKWCDYTGLTVEQSLGDGWVEALHSDDRIIAKPLWTTMLKQKTFFELEYRLKNAAGNYRWHLTRAEPVYDNDKNIIAIIGTCTDIHLQRVLKDELENKVNERTAQLQQLNQTFNYAEQTSNIGSFRYQIKTGKFTYSDNLFRILGCEPGEFEPCEENFFKYVYPGDLEYVQKGFKHFLQTKELYDIDFRIITKSGNLIYGRNTGMVIREDDEDVLIGTLQDITAQVAKENELLQQKQFVESVIDASVDAIAVYDCQDRYIYFNSQAEKMYGVSRDNVIGKKIKDMFPLASGSEDYKLLKEAFKGQSIHQPKTYSMTGRIIEVFFVPIFDSENRTDAVLTIVRDITESIETNEKLKQAILSLEERKNFVEAILDASADNIYVVNDELRIVSMNRRAINSTHDTDAIGKNLLEVYPSMENTAAYNEVLRALRGEVVSNSNYNSMVTGKVYENFFIPLKTGEKKHSAIIIAHDITDIIQAKEKLEHSNLSLEEKNIQLQKMNEELASFVYISSHDLQEPLRKIQTFISAILYEESKVLSERGRDYFKRVADSAARMQTLIQDLLAYSNTSTSQRTFKRTDINEIVAHVKKDLQDNIGNSGAVIEADNLPVMNVIRSQFKLMLTNLVGNSIKFARKGIVPHIIIKDSLVSAESVKEVRANHVQQFHHIMISDNGMGFDSQFKNKIFELFQRLHPKSEYPGTGLGLAICKKIVENHNGIITAEGELNKGATFHIYLPAD